LDFDPIEEGTLTLMSFPTLEQQPEVEASSTARILSLSGMTQFVKGIIFGTKAKVT
jgi:hypothetical protein